MSEEKQKPLLMSVQYVDEGMKVIAPYDRKTGQGIRCVVATAAGYHARVVNEEYKFDRWFHVDDLRQEAGR